MAKQGPSWVLGTMSGTSLDGVDAAMLRTDGHVILEFGPHAYRPYSAAEQATIRKAFGQWPGDPDVAAAAEVVETAHAELLSRFSGAEMIGFHGQTLAHDPAQGRTHQAGNGALLAEALNLPVVWDFRSNDVQMGGQGAPLAPFFHFACAKWIKASDPLAILNLGGVGNITWIDPSQPSPETPGALLAFDTGPANAPINDLMQIRLGLAQDEGGSLAATGRSDEALVKAFLAQPYFYKIPPKSLDRNDFRAFFKKTHRLSNADAAATLTAIAAACVAKATEHFPKPITRLLVAGGGRHNATLMTQLRQRLACPVDPIESVTLNGDMLEAQAFAYLAARVACGLPTSCPSTTGVPAAIGGGQISRR
ncbi:MAG: anhydro-N-acetylmuramic acid kinase [Rhodobacteraceae bacterium]|uniref:anhydro-N-acetylmuramic acid kinase n=1 Tax=Cypionkella sp. TaxID=2811411 RepID=UPI001320F1A2|nr:anhydro-N-acetylmuramic acid kinase [Cypionkella sp.]KAF0172014.1 MAG: anhydro-N-acetylmuramic acid kinase [Paracoccaceae bacterium]MDO8326119.1 anhydro-N-acetylmuramic acid kinase [Cypionkella sp.]